ncbi:MAG: nucleotidyltransferase domain-containing protein [Anaerolineales bacterium]|jgi:predicted nucleotidyltransferase
MHSAANTLSKTVRLEQETINKLSRLFSEHLRDYPDAIVILFGSRADLKSKGGDLDLLIVSRRAAPHAYELSKRLRMAIKEELGDQRVDILVTTDSPEGEQSPFVQLAIMDGVRIWP